MTVLPIKGPRTRSGMAKAIRGIGGHSITLFEKDDIKIIHYLSYHIVAYP
jgi:hypothetical protein